MKKKPRGKEPKIRHTLPIEEVNQMYITLLAGNDFKAVTAAEKEVKARVLKDIAYAKKMGYQIELPSGDGT